MTYEDMKEMQKKDEWEKSELLTEEEQKILREEWQNYRKNKMKFADRHKSLGPYPEEYLKDSDYWTQIIMEEPPALLTPIFSHLVPLITWETLQDYDPLSMNSVEMSYLFGCMDDNLNLSLNVLARMTPGERWRYYFGTVDYLPEEQQRDQAKLMSRIQDFEDYNRPYPNQGMVAWYRDNDPNFKMAMIMGIAQPVIQYRFYKAMEAFAKFTVQQTRAMAKRGQFQFRTIDSLYLPEAMVTEEVKPEYALLPLPFTMEQMQKQYVLQI